MVSVHQRTAKIPIICSMAAEGGLASSTHNSYVESDRQEGQCFKKNVKIPGVAAASSNTIEGFGTFECVSLDQV